MKTYLSLGSNLGNRLLNLTRAVQLVQQRQLLQNLQCSVVIETEALLPKNAPPGWNKPFLNMIVTGGCGEGPRALLAALKAIEADLGRDMAAPKWSPRVIDIDILLMDDTTLNSAKLIIPHPELQNRPFLLHLLGFLKGEVYKTFNLHPKLVGIVNITPDSFSDGGRYLQPDKAIEKALELHAHGAHVVELGAQSTRPGAALIPAKDEYDLLRPVLNGLEGQFCDHGIQISIDSFSKEVILKILANHKISWINDVTGRLDDSTFALIAQTCCKIVVMHSLSIPASPEVRISDKEDPVAVINDWSKQIVERLLRCGFKTESIILDPGIGFGKSAYHSLLILKNISQLQKFGCEMLVGHSRKSYISSFCCLKPAERDLETISISEHLAACGVDYLRVHDVLGHQRFFVARSMMNAL